MKLEPRHSTGPRWTGQRDQGDLLPRSGANFDSPWFDSVRARLGYLGYPVGSRTPPPAKSRGPAGGGQGGDGRGTRRYRGPGAGGPGRPRGIGTAPGVHRPGSPGPSPDLTARPPRRGPGGGHEERRITSLLSRPDRCRPGGGLDSPWFDPVGVAGGDFSAARGRPTRRPDARGNGRRPRPGVQSPGPPGGPHSWGAPRPCPAGVRGVPTPRRSEPWFSELAARPPAWTSPPRPLGRPRVGTGRPPGRALAGRPEAPRGTGPCCR